MITNCFVPEECKIQNQKAADNKWWLFHFQSCIFLSGAFITEFKAALCEDLRGSLPLIWFYVLVLCVTDQ